MWVAMFVLGGFAALAGSDLPQRLQAAGAKSPPPETNRLAVDAILVGHAHLALAGGEGQNNATA